MLARSELVKLLELGRDGKSEGIAVVPNPLALSEKQVGGASIDLRLGRWFLVLRQSKKSVIDLSTDDGGPLEGSDGHYHYVPFGGHFVVHPGRFVLASTLEWINLPTYLGAYITGKSSLGRRGLIIETAAGIHPRFSGCLALEITNCGEIPISVTPGMRIAQLFFHRVEGDSEEAPASFNGNRKPVFGQHKLDFIDTATQPGLW